MKNNIPSSEAVTLKEYVNDKFNNLEKAIDVRFENVVSNTANAMAASERAIHKADTTIEKRLDSMNEFRAVLADQAKDLLPRAEYNSRHQALIDKIDTTTTRIAAIENQTKGGEITIGKIYAAIAAVGAVLAIIVLIANGVLK